MVGLVERLGQLDGSRLRKLSTIAAASGTQNRPQASAMDSSSCMNRVAVERSVSSTRRPPAQVYGGVNGHPTRVWHAQDLETTQTYLQSARGSFGQWAFALAKKTTDVSAMITHAVNSLAKELPLQVE